MAAASAITVVRGRKQFGAVFDELFYVSATLDPASLADGVGETDTVAVTGVALGDIVIGSSINVDLVGITVTAYVSATDVVSFRIQNESTATVDLASKTIKILVGRPSW